MLSSMPYTLIFPSLDFHIVAFIIFSFFISILTVILSFRTYLRITCGLCTSDRDMSGKVVIITGANTGIGMEAARELARRNAKVILACRNLSMGQIAATDITSSTGNSNILVKSCDLSSLKSVRNFADDILNSESRLDVLICNAGGGSPPGRRLTEDGFEVQFQTNHLGHFLLVNLLMDLLKSSGTIGRSSRIVITSSLAHRFGNIDLENMVKFERYIPHPFLTYCDTKLANLLFMKELDRRLEGSSVTVNALHPGTVYTNGIRSVQIWYIKYFLLFLCFLYGHRTEEDGAQTILHLALEESLEGTSGLYFADCSPTNYSPLADDVTLSQQLWNLSEKSCGLQHKNKYHHVYCL